uniref:Uncharacterized protein n=1 Tax=Meloidogyne enterolobii TaxID=390850 RepID=A0A6V7VI87_MELEN|nr:unnamed protein product [Meloidogyne enterolobii]
MYFLFLCLIISINILILCQATGNQSLLYNKSLLTSSSFVVNGIKNNKILNKKRLDFWGINSKNKNFPKLFSVNPLNKKNFVIKNGNDDKQIKIRLAKSEDAKALFSLIKELAEFHKMSKTIRISAEQIEKDLNSGFLHSLIAFGEKGEVAAYALYYLYGSSTKSMGKGGKSVTFLYKFTISLNCYLEFKIKIKVIKVPQ